jgi:hypothetical protein
MSYGWSRLNPYGSGFLRMGSDPGWDVRGAQAVYNYDSLVKRVGTISDEKVRQDILAWLGDPNQLGTPADRYDLVKETLIQGAAWDDQRTQYVQDLEQVNRDLKTKVESGEKAGTYGPFGTLSPVNDQGQLTGVGIGLVVTAALGLVVVPLLIK